MSPSGQRHPRQYRTGDITSVPAGAGMELAYCRDSQATELMPRSATHRLRRITRFAPLADHARILAGGRPNAVSAILVELERLVSAGFLVAEPSTPDHDGADTGPRGCGASHPSGIGCLAFPTRDRVATFEATVASYLANAERDGRAVPVLVSDDSPDPTTRDSYRDMLSRLSQRFRSPIEYLGLAERESLALAVAKLAELPVEVVRFACLGDRSAGLTTVGANRNSILLHTIDELVVMADDDVMCRIAAAPCHRDPAVVSSAGGQLDQREFPDRDAALASWPAAEASLLGMHERWLGRPPLACLGGDADFDRASPATVRRLTSRCGRIAVTMTGIVGDCAWDNADHLLAEGHPLPRSREWSQVAPRPTLTDRPDPLFGWCIGLDNRHLLPPFTPLGRAEEVAFGQLLARCFADHYLTYLPWALLHAPPEQRAFSTEPPFAVGFNAWLPSILGIFDPGYARDPITRLAIIGAAVIELARLPGDDFRDFIRMHLLRSLELLVTRLEEGAADAPGEEIQSTISRLVAAGSGPLERLYPMPGSPQAVQRLLVRFGTMLTAWPAMVAAATTLRRSDQTFARPIHP